MKNLSLRLVLLYSILLCMIAWILTSCVTSKKVNRYLEKHPEEFARICSDEFPVEEKITVKETVKVDTIYVESEPEIIKDSFWIKGDTVIKQITKQCPPHQVVTKTVTKDSIIIRRDRAFETVQSNEIAANVKEIASLKTDITELEGKVKNRTKKMWLFLFIAIALGVWNFRKLIAKLIIPMKPF